MEASRVLSEEQRRQLEGFYAAFGHSTALGCGPVLPAPTHSSKRNNDSSSLVAPPLPDVLPDAARVVALGDVHGDFDKTVRALCLAKVVDEKLHWVGGQSVLVQVRE